MTLKGFSQLFLGLRPCFMGSRVFSGTVLLIRVLSFKCQVPEKDGKEEEEEEEERAS